MSWSRADWASRMPPSAPRATAMSAPSSASIFSASQMARRRWVISRVGMRLRSKRWQRDRMVAGTLFDSVVANMNFTCAGGSSSVFNRALKAAVESMCTSSMM